MSNNTNTIYAEMLISDMEYAHTQINADSIGISNFRKLKSAVMACLSPAYNVRRLQFAAMTENVQNPAIQNSRYSVACVNTIDKTALRDAARVLVDLVGEVNGTKLNVAAVADEISFLSTRITKVSVSKEHAHAVYELRNAKKADDENAITLWEDTLADLESKPGNARRECRRVNDSAFFKNVLWLLSNALNRVTLMTETEISAEKAAKKAARDALKK